MKADEAGIEISGRRWSASDFVRADGTPGPWTSKALEADPLSFEGFLSIDTSGQKEALERINASLRDLCRK